MERFLDIKGHIVQAYVVCKRQAWLLSRNISPVQDNPFLEIGKLISQQFYKHDKKEVYFDGVVLDLIRKEDEVLVVGEIKKSSKKVAAAILQLKFYLYKLLKHNIKARGKLLIPEEKKTYDVELTFEDIETIESLLSEITEVLSSFLPPLPQKIKACAKCSYKEFCWA
ncbi:CRISPR-associated protein Cas4 [Caldicellulosiruptor acetigenus I77R1B]|uniref:CRISPR-associated exonuclease Cas4 n=2 Tax=Caldicellulosiruptor acetigenus TaxID=301953 RepID=G2PYP7_9FIRM|nr:CRISPR-associated protein Cas4 [Caldicellulosiruptor acetigenus]ADQ42001.1 CRISPR-associated protein Cas4 [Caldicellulosiruptor acetigenus I77R1B]AEM74966.1 CRISPR-associated protein Cas4 [Caldicellulosiruptor acetigenus 6A]WAM36208.1 CRISPR-associated protein Cas4 [Caldicellulosiruptor acetigenus]